MGDRELGTEPPSRSRIRAARPESLQLFATERGEHERKVLAAEQRHELNRLTLEHKHAEQHQDNAFRRLRLRIVLFLLAGALIAAAAVSVIGDDASTRQWAQNVVTTLLGGLLGAVAGYFAGKSGN